MCVLFLTRSYPNKQSNSYQSNIVLRLYTKQPSRNIFNSVKILYLDHSFKLVVVIASPNVANFHSFQFLIIILSFLSIANPKYFLTSISTANRPVHQKILHSINLSSSC